MTALFVYGTLMQDSHVQLLLRRTICSRPAKLLNYMRVAPVWSFPFIVPQKGNVTYGRVLMDLTDEDIKLIDAFEDEGALYVRRKVRVIFDDQTRMIAQTYLGRVDALQRSFGAHVEFTDRFAHFLERKINTLVDQMPTDRPELRKRVLQELMGSAVASILDLIFEGNYLCNYIMIQTLQQAKPPHLTEILRNEKARPYAGNYMLLACRHIILNQFVDFFRDLYPEQLRVESQFLRYGLAVLAALMYFNRCARRIDTALRKAKLDIISDHRGYRDYASSAIEIADAVFKPERAKRIIEEVDAFWYPAETPLGAELEFSNLGARAVDAGEGEDAVYDSFYYFNDFDLMRRTWRLGGHVDSHCSIVNDQTRSRGFLEYALGRYQIVGDLSRPLFVCPWALSRIINELVKFAPVAPHSLHISMEVPDNTPFSTDNIHTNDNLACLLLLGGDFGLDDTGKLREMRIFRHELSPNNSSALNFYDRKLHYNASTRDENASAEVLEFKFLRLHPDETDYEMIITALKGYMYGARARPLTAHSSGDEQEQRFLRSYAADPQPLSEWAIDNFIELIRQGLLTEQQTLRLGPMYRNMLSRVRQHLLERNDFIRSFVRHG